jgi:hypothetical protein
LRPIRANAQARDPAFLVVDASRHIDRTGYGRRVHVRNFRTVLQQKGDQFPIERVADAGFQDMSGGTLARQSDARGIRGESLLWMAKPLPRSLWDRRMAWQLRLLTAHLTAFPLNEHAGIQQSCGFAPCY